jgi:hypothetical protein
MPPIVTTAEIERPAARVFAHRRRQPPGHGIGKILCPSWSAARHARRCRKTLPRSNG